VAVVDISDDPNARSTITPVPPTPTPAVTPTAAPSPTPAPLADQDVVNGIVAQSMEPLLVGGRVGLIGAIAAGVLFLAVQRIRPRR
jgi:hypothetical protein